MISALARGDYDDMVADGLKPTLEDFDRMNTIALRLTDGGETTAANFPRVGWAGNIPFFQPTCAAFAWYIQFAERASANTDTKDSYWFYALAHARNADAFATLFTPSAIADAVGKWLAALPVTRDEIRRACRFAACGYDDAVVGKTEAKAEADEKKSEAELSAENLDALGAKMAEASAVTGIPTKDMMTETPSRLRAMVDAVRALHIGGDNGGDRSRLQADYDLTFMEIRRRLVAERDAEMNAEANDGE